MADECLAAQIVVLGQHDLQLLSKVCDHVHVNVEEGVGRRGASRGGERVVLLPAEELARLVFPLVCPRFCRPCEAKGLTLPQKGLDRKLVDQAYALVDRVLLVQTLLLNVYLN